MKQVFIASLWAGALILPVATATCAEPLPRPLAAEVRDQLGRPTLFVDNAASPRAMYSPAGHGNRQVFDQEMSYFLRQPLSAWFVCLGAAVQPAGDEADFFATPFCKSDMISAKQLATFHLPPDEQAEKILASQPDAVLFVRFSLREPASWRKLHLDQLVVTEQGERLPHPSLASEAFWDACGRYAAAVIAYGESRPWAHRIVGYASFMRLEGTHEPMLHYALFDHGPAMTARWRKCLRDTYETLETIRAAYGDPTLWFDTAQVPTDKIKGTTADVAKLHYSQAAAAAQAELDRLGRKRVLVYDSHKSTMLGWDNTGFFDRKAPWPHAYPELTAGSGNMQVAKLLAGLGIGGLITPHDDQARGAGGVFTTTPGLPVAFWRNAARHAGAHVWCEQDELVMADAGLVALHSIVSGRKTLRLPGRRQVIDVITGKIVAESTDRIEFDMIGPDTRVFRITAS